MSAYRISTWFLKSTRPLETDSFTGALWFEAEMTISFVAYSGASGDVFTYNVTRALCFLNPFLISEITSQNYCRYLRGARVCTIEVCYIL